MMTICKHVICFLLYYSGLLKVFERLCMPRTQARILLYHRVNDRRGEYFPPVSVRHFRQHLAYLQKAYTIVPLGKIAEAVRLRSALPARTAAITFDDGYADIYRDVFPLIRADGVPITVFLTADCIQTGRPMWTDVLHDCFAQTAVKAISLPELGVGTLPLESGTEKKEACLAVKERLKSLDEPRKLEMISRLRGMLGAAERKEPLMLTGGQVRALSDAGIEMGSHSLTHPNLSIAAPALLARELSSSKNAIEECAGHPVKGFSYPSGYDGTAARDAVRAAGYEYACVVGGGTVDVRGSDLFAMQRIYITDVPVYVFAVEISGIMHFIRKAVRHDHER
jgi:peptidoglycan/xylan/chitin deacetylase (PgdA/CDA1 family)